MEINLVGEVVATSHSPFLIQSLRSGEELIMLDGQLTAQVANMTVEEIALRTNPITRPRSRR